MPFKGLECWDEPTPLSFPALKCKCKRKKSSILMNQSAVFIPSLLSKICRLKVCLGSYANLVI